MVTTDPLLAVGRSLDDGEAVEFMHAAVERWPRLAGARVADVLELTTSHDMFLGLTEPWFESYSGEFRGGLPLTAVLHTLIILGRELTVLNVTKILLRAGLMPGREPALAWSLVIRGPGTVTGYQAESARWHYLTGLKDGSAGYFLTRWTRGGLSHLDDLAEAVRNAAAVDSSGQGRRLAEMYEAGLEVDLGPAWRHVPREGVSTT